MNYVDLNVVRYAAMVLVNAEENGQTVWCEHDTENGMCGEPTKYLVPDATRPGGGSEYRATPGHVLSGAPGEMLGHPPAEQSIFRHIVGPEE